MKNPMHSLCANMCVRIRRSAKTIKAITINQTRKNCSLLIP